MLSCAGWVVGMAWRCSMALARGLLSKIHIARQQLGLQDDVYRQKLQAMFGKTSAKELSPRQAEQLLAEFKRLGWKPKPGKKTQGKPRNWQQLPAEIEVIEAQLANMNLPWSYADAITKQMFGVARVAWLAKKPDQVRAILAALHVEQEKRQLLADVEHLCQRLGIEHPEQVAGLEHLPKEWRRQRPILKTLVETLYAAAEGQRRS
ncbi:gp16 family protein [Pseudomonas aeruginosa]|uniref:gp16 family protein n=1 Tax=Pseudomonas aeruginosa TaxID=287 RepID=UPI001F09CCEA|nr:regulatory protein GemA [Pseudomonas aeruginosa]